MTHAVTYRWLEDGTISGFRLEDLISPDQRAYVDSLEPVEDPHTLAQLDQESRAHGIDNTAVLLPHGTTAETGDAYWACESDRYSWFAGELNAAAERCDWIANNARERGDLAGAEFYADWGMNYRTAADQASEDADTFAELAKDHPQTTSAA